MNAGRRFSFGPYQLDLDQRMLFRGAEPVPLTPRLFDLLVLLVDNAGRVLSKDEILEKVWGQTIVEDGTITWHLHALRQALSQGDETAKYIDTVPKRGYRFVAEITPGEERRRGAEASAPRSQRHWWLAVAASLVLAACLVMFLRGGSEPALPYAQRDWLLISSFENQTGESRFDRALFTALTVSLEQSTFVNVFPRARVATTLERMRKPSESVIDDALAREICLREGLRALVSPSITRTGKKYAVAARLTDPKTGNTVRAYLIHAEDENGILGAVQELSARVRRDLGESIAQIATSNRPLAQVTTANFQALQLYSEAVEDRSLGRMGDAIRKLESALAADADFAMANAALGKIMYGTTRQRPDLGNEYFQRALALSARVTDRERQLIAADFAASRGQLDEAVKLYTAYATTYPDDLSMLGRMGDLLLAAGNFAAAEKALRAALAIDSNVTSTNFSLGAALANQGDFAQARKYIERAIALEPMLITRGTFGSTYGFVLFGAGDREAALKFFVGQAAAEGLRYRAERAFGLIAMHDGKYSDAVKRFQASIDAQNGSSDVNLARARNYGYLAAVLARQGKREEALKALDLGVASLDTHGPAPVEFRARFVTAYARLGQISAAIRQLDKIVAGADVLRPKDRSIVALAQGEVAVARGEWRSAIELFDSARLNIGTDLPLLLEARAHAVQASGDRAAAIEAWREVAALRGRWLAWEAQEDWLLAHLQLAKLYHEQARDADAKAALGPLLARWGEADPDLPAAIELRRLADALNPPALAQAKPVG